MTPSTSAYGRRIGEQARRIGRPPSILYRLIRKQGLPATLIGGCWHIKDDDLDNFFREKTAKRLKKPVPIDQKAHDAADRALSEGGW
jgi:hypothetical protein